jgi:hypothetical protein
MAGIVGLVAGIVGLAPLVITRSRNTPGTRLAMKKLAGNENAAKKPSAFRGYPAAS